VVSRNIWIMVTRQDLLKMPREKLERLADWLKLSYEAHSDEQLIALLWRHIKKKRKRR
jgi:hypothetical protein